MLVLGNHSTGSKWLFKPPANWVSKWLFWTTSKFTQNGCFEPPLQWLNYTALSHNLNSSKCWFWVTTQLAQIDFLSHQPIGSQNDCFEPPVNWLKITQKGLFWANNQLAQNVCFEPPPQWLNFTALSNNLNSSKYLFWVTSQLAQIDYFEPPANWVSKWLFWANNQLAQNGCFEPPLQCLNFTVLIYQSDGSNCLFWVIS